MGTSLLFSTFAPPSPKETSAKQENSLLWQMFELLEYLNT